MFYSITLDSGGAGIGSNVYDVPPTTLPKNEIACNANQAQAPSLYGVVNGILSLLPIPLAAAQAIQIASVNAAAQAALASIVDAYPDLEVSTWQQQYAEAQAYTANTAAKTPLLSAISTASGSPVASLVQGVMAKAAAYQAASGAVIGKRIALSTQIMAATTNTAVEAIVW